MQIPHMNATSRLLPGRDGTAEPPASYVAARASPLRLLRIRGDDRVKWAGWLAPSSTVPLGQDGRLHHPADGRGLPPKCLVTHRLLFIPRLGDLPGQAGWSISFDVHVDKLDNIALYSTSENRGPAEPWAVVICSPRWLNRSEILDRWT